MGRNSSVEFWNGTVKCFWAPTVWHAKTVKCISPKNFEILKKFRGFICLWSVWRKNPWPSRRHCTVWKSTLKRYHAENFFRETIEQKSAKSDSTNAWFSILRGQFWIIYRKWNLVTSIHTWIHCIWVFEF